MGRVGGAHEDLSSRWLGCVLVACVLCALRPGPAYGYEIAGRIAAAGFDRPKGGTLYPILARLEADAMVVPSWIEGDGGPPRKYYDLTDTGADAAAQVAREWRVFAVRVATLLGDPDRATS